jgi:hypothetical protein
MKLPHSLTALKSILIPGLALCASLLASPVALAHSDAALDALPSPHGGQVRMAGNWHFELVVAHQPAALGDKPVVIHVTDHAGSPVPTQGASGTLTLLSGKTRSTVQLTPDGDNRLKGQGRYASTAKLKAVAQITLAGQPVQQARYTPLAPRAGLNAAGDSHTH